MPTGPVVLRNVKSLDFELGFSTNELSSLNDKGVHDRFGFKVAAGKLEPIRGNCDKT